MRFTALTFFVLTCWPPIAVADQLPSAQQQKDVCDNLRKKAQGGSPLDSTEQQLFKDCININNNGGTWQVVPVEQYFTTVPSVDFKNFSPGTAIGIITK
jgi:hypothetical protein